MAKPRPNFANLADRISAGGHIVIHSDFCEPQALVQQLVDHAAGYSGVNLHTLMPVIEPAYVQGDAPKHFVINSFFPGGGLRRAVNAGLVSLRRCQLSDIPAFFTNKAIRADMVLLQVSRPNAQGQVSLGVSVDYMNEVLAQRPIVVAQMNSQMPFTHGEGVLDLADIDYLLEHNEPLLSVAAAAPDAVDTTIAKHVASLINNGDVLQAGIGALPDAVLANVGHLKHLGAHTGILTKAWQPLIEAGVVDNSTKAIYTGKTVTTMAGGDAEFYGYLHDNPTILFNSCAYTHSFNTLAAIDNLIAVNSVLQLDLCGDANAESVNGRVISSPGGLPDFANGAAAANGGKSIIAMRSSFKNGKYSNIVAKLSDDAPRTLNAAAINYVVTEYGIAALNELNPEQRAEALIAIAHPDHREQLRHDWAALCVAP